jgi:hypothetical protein
MKSKIVASLLVFTAGIALFAGAARVVHGSYSSQRCGPGSIAFRALIGGGEKRFRCSEGTWYDFGQRQYSARLNGPVKAKYVTVVLARVQYTGARRLLLRTVLPIRDAAIKTIRGTVAFSSADGTSSPAGAPPIGTYLVSIHRGTSAGGKLLAQGQFQVIGN